MALIEINIDLLAGLQINLLDVQKTKLIQLRLAIMEQGVSGSKKIYVNVENVDQHHSVEAAIWT